MSEVPNEIWLLLLMLSVLNNAGSASKSSFLVVFLLVFCSFLRLRVDPIQGYLANAAAHFSLLLVLVPYNPDLLARVVVFLLPTGKKGKGNMTWEPQLCCMERREEKCYLALGHFWFFLLLSPTHHFFIATFTFRPRQIFTFIMNACICKCTQYSELSRYRFFRQLLLDSDKQWN